MRPFRGVRWVCALVLLAAGVAPAHAAWDNVFQVCCFGCKNHQPAVSNYAACAPPCPQQTCCTTQYVQRSYYQPVTCYQTQTYYEPVTSYRTSYYYEPVTSYRYSCYYDPCTCSYQQMACPQTCYRLRSQCCATTSYLQRTCQVPVTSYQLSYYYEPVTTCTQTPACPPPCQAPCAAPCSTPAAPAPSATPAVTEQPSQPPMPPAGVQEQRSAPNYPPPGNGDAQRIYPQAQPTNPPPMPPAGPTNLRQVAPPAPRQGPPPVVRLDRIVALPAAGQVNGQVVRNDNTPTPVRLTFVNATQKGPQETVSTDNTGRFRVTLASGSWLVYMTASDGKPVFHSKIEVRGEQARQIVLVSR